MEGRHKLLYQHKMRSFLLHVYGVGMYVCMHRCTYVCLQVIKRADHIIEPNYPVERIIEWYARTHALLEQRRMMELTLCVMALTVPYLACPVILL